MSSTTVLRQGPSPVHDYGLGAVAQHNAIATTEPFPEYDSKGLRLYDGSNGEDAFSFQPTPISQSNTEVAGMRTRSGRSTKRTDSPLTSTTSRISKSPASKKSKKTGSKIDKIKTPKLTAPLSILTKDTDVPIKDMDAWVHRSAETRQEEVKNRDGYVTRPMNAFMLYRSAYAERTKAWASQNNHQVVSSMAGESWPMEPDDVRAQFNEWARIERGNHAAAHPDYKFSPSKSKKCTKRDFSDDEDDASDLGRDPDGEYRAGGRRVRQRPYAPQQEVMSIPANVGFNSNPYYAHQGVNYDMGQYQSQYHTPRHTIPSNIAQDARGFLYNPQTGRYIQTAVPQQTHPAYAYPQQHQQQQHIVRVDTPASLNGLPTSATLGGIGLPGGGSDDLLSPSRTATPMQHLSQYQQYQQFMNYHNATAAAAMHPQHLYEHQQYLQTATQPQAAIDPGLDHSFADELQFEDGFAGFDVGQVGAPVEYYPPSTSPNQTLAPRREWNGEDLGV